ncbi:IclR family transcriptional regulator [Actinopolymorpha alba]|uniref:IclR family transcriptional regulator n=1 Tax=Actinopolymorpha alba TaxID=533267 RepID=UPI00035EDE8E|nr:IclR family transcriptional regulator [Actinopolymorpha alba]
MAGRGEPTLIGSVQRALRLLDAVGAADRPVPAKVLARQTGQPLPTTYHLLRTLVHEGYLCRVEDGYLLGDRIAALSHRSRGQLIALRVRPTLRMLHDELGSAAYLSFYEDGEIRLVDVVDSPAAPRVDLWVGFHDAGHATALGKCLLACLPEDDRRDYLARHDLNDLTPHTITDSKVLLARLETEREYSLDREEYAVGTVCVAAPVKLEDLTGAVAVSLPSRRLERVFEKRQAISRAAQRIAFALATENT